MAFRHVHLVVSGDMMIDGLTPPVEGAAAQSLWAVRGAGCRRWRGLTATCPELAAVLYPHRDVRLARSHSPASRLSGDRGRCGGLGGDGERVVAELGQDVHGLADD